MQADAPVVVGRVVWPAEQGEQVFGVAAWTAVENFPAAQAEHFFVVPSLYFPATHAVQVDVHDGPAVIPSASRAAPVASHRTQEDAPATLAVPDGQDWQVMLDLVAENFPAVHAAHDAPDTMVPGAHMLHTMAGPPGE
jgi:hypothetical protein